ncbi:MAG: (2Fe-2S)-binding protein [Rhodospirillales bacterium]|nr:(2Fe-2S)-binding protein [Rhodospirillales bacterium]
MSNRLFRLHVNGVAREVEAAESASLLDVLRGPLGLTGTKSNCLEAECGVCTVLLDGRAVTSCLVLAAQCEGSEIVTIEGLAEAGGPHPLQSAFLEHGAVQCGYCIPGMIMTAAGLLREKHDPDDDEIREAMAGTLCRCTGYAKIVAAVKAAARNMRQGR